MAPMSGPTIDDVHFIDFGSIPGENAELFVYESNVPFAIRRVFVVRADAVIRRGEHAHRQCAQLLFALNSTCIVTVDDGVRRRDIRLESPTHGLHIPPLIWAGQRYEEGGIVIVLCDAPYDEADYIRDYATFKECRGIPA